jgi:outer membrane protein
MIQGDDMKFIRSRRFTSILLNLWLAASFVALGFAIGNMYTPVSSQAAAYTVGYVNIERLLEEHPSWDSVYKKIVEYEEKELKKLDKYSASGNLSPEQKKESLDLAIELREKIKEKRKELTKPLYDDILKKANEVGRESGVEVVLDSAVVLYGGLDLTPAVKVKLSKNL